MRPFLPFPKFGELLLPVAVIVLFMRPAKFS